MEEQPKAKTTEEKIWEDGRAFNDRNHITSVQNSMLLPIPTDEPKSPRYQSPASLTMQLSDFTSACTRFASSCMNIRARCNRRPPLCSSFSHICGRRARLEPNKGMTSASWACFPIPMPTAEGWSAISTWRKNNCHLVYAMFEHSRCFLQSSLGV